MEWVARLVPIYFAFHVVLAITTAAFAPGTSCGLGANDWLCGTPIEGWVSRGEDGAPSNLFTAAVGAVQGSLDVVLGIFFLNYDILQSENQLASAVGIIIRVSGVMITVIAGVLVLYGVFRR